MSRSEFEKRIKPYDTEDEMDKALYNFAHDILISCPSVRPTLASCEDAISRKAAQDLLIDHFNNTDVATHYRGINSAVKAWLGEVQSVQPQTVDWDAMIEEIKEETIPMVDAEENDYWDVKYGLFEEDILEIINKYRNGERNE